MTVAELITRLQQLPGDWPVYVAASHAGVDDVVNLNPGFFVRDYNSPDSYEVGPHQQKYDGDSNGVQLVGGTP